jgi:integrase
MKPFKKTSEVHSDRHIVAISASPHDSVHSATAIDYAAAAQSAATTLAYAADIRHFVKFGGVIPALPSTVAAYLASYAGLLSIATLRRRLVAIHQAHVSIGLISPVKDATVKKTMQGIRRTFGTKQRRVIALVKDDLLELMVFVDQQKPLKAARDRALLLIGFAGAFRRSELVALRVEDVTWYDGGIELCLRRSKTDQEGEGRTVFIPSARGVRCPTTALADWLKLAGIRQGPLFKSVNCHDNLISHRGLTPAAVGQIVKSIVRKKGGNEAALNVAGHSLRAGFCTEAAMVGMPTYQIREVTGHKSDATLSKYIRPASQRKIPSLL